MKNFLLYLILFLPLWAKSGQLPTVTVEEQNSVFINYHKVAVLEDPSNLLTFKEIQSEPFKINQQKVPSFGLSNHTQWLKFSLLNKTKEDEILIHISYSLLDSVTIFYPTLYGSYYRKTSGTRIPIQQRDYQTQEIVFNLPVKQNQSALLYLKIKSSGTSVAPIFAGSKNTILSELSKEDVLFGIYMGLIGIMLIYNLFIFLSAKDKDYLFYAFYVAAIAFTQITIQGYGYRFFWNDSRFFINQSNNLAGILSGISTILFTMSFLRTRELSKKFDYFLRLAIGIYLIGFILSLLGVRIWAYRVINAMALIGSIIVITWALVMSFRGYKSALYYSIALSIFLISVIIYALESSGIGLIPFNIYTKNILSIGSSIEVALLSFALADKINTYRKEKDLSQKEALIAAQETERFISKQNIILEKKVNDRTQKLRDTNENLNATLNKLKNAQSQLVEAEKMSSLGQLTAGIAHEINNPINFVKSNIKPLTLDIQDLMELLHKQEDLRPDNYETKRKEIDDFKEEIDFEYLKKEIKQILAAIEDGAMRTTTIVQGLRSFSRLDEGAVKDTDIHQGIDKTLVLLRSKIPKDFKIVKDYGDIPKIECFPGRLNQVFMNILSNAIQAITDSPSKEKGLLIIRTRKEEENILLQIKDNGPGISEDIREKIFDPFFTTKEVGKGTGLGLSISYSIIEEHSGKITINSEIGKGTQFNILLPITFQGKGK